MKQTEALPCLIFRNIIMIINNPVRSEVDSTGLSLHPRKLKHKNSFLQATLVAGTHLLYWYRQVTELSNYCMCVT